MPTCDKCFWSEHCAEDEVCEHFSPLNEDEFFDCMAEKDRHEFYDEWLEYIDPDGE